MILTFESKEAMKKNNNRKTVLQLQSEACEIKGMLAEIAIKSRLIEQKLDLEQQTLNKSSTDLVSEKLTEEVNKLYFESIEAFDKYSKRLQEIREELSTLRK